jgi:hypothetical protein
MWSIVAANNLVALTVEAARMEKQWWSGMSFSLSLRLRLRSEISLVAHGCCVAQMDWPSKRSRGLEPPFSSVRAFRQQLLSTLICRKKNNGVSLAAAA